MDNKELDNDANMALIVLGNAVRNLVHQDCMILFVQSEGQITQEKRDYLSEKKLPKNMTKHQAVKYTLIDEILSGKNAAALQQEQWIKDAQDSCEDMISCSGELLQSFLPEDNVFSILENLYNGIITEDLLKNLEHLDD